MIISIIEAIRCAKKLGKEILKTHVYDDEGIHLFDAGKF